MPSDRTEYLKAYYQSHKNEYAERSKAWRKANPEKSKALYKKYNKNRHKKTVEYRKVTREKRLAWQRAYDAERRDKEKAREATKKWRDKNGKNYRHAWHSKNPGKGAAYAAKRRARKFYATPKWLNRDQLRRIDDIYTEAAELGMDVDHVVPLQGKSVCGLHVPWNLQLLEPNDNKTKANRLPPEHDCISQLSAHP